MRSVDLKTKVIIAALAALALLFTGCGKQSQGGQDLVQDHSECTLESLEQRTDGRGSAFFEGKQHDFLLYLPDNVEGAPLIIMLHGYGESAESFRLKTAVENEANAAGYAVAYITGASTPEDPTSTTGWNSGIGVSSNNDVDFLCAFVNDLCGVYPFDRTRIYAVGFSNGAFMAHRLAVEASDIFAAVVSVAGMMPEKVWKSKPEKCEVGFFQITGEKDDTVPKNSDGSARFSKAPAIEDVMDY